MHISRSPDVTNYITNQVGITILPGVNHRRLPEMSSEKALLVERRGNEMTTKNQYIVDTLI